MVQTGDPTGTGKGGTSIWNKKFEDEIRDDLKHSTRGIVSIQCYFSASTIFFFLTYYHGKEPSYMEKLIWNVI